MPNLWIHGGLIPPCACGAPSEDQVRRYGGGAIVHWFCLVCGLFRGPPPGWDDRLVPSVSRRGELPRWTSTE